MIGIYFSKEYIWLSVALLIVVLPLFPFILKMHKKECMEIIAVKNSFGEAAMEQLKLVIFTPVATDKKIVMGRSLVYEIVDADKNLIVKVIFYNKYFLSYQIEKIKVPKQSGYQLRLGDIVNTLHAVDKHSTLHVKGIV